MSSSISSECCHVVFVPTDHPRPATAVVNITRQITCKGANFILTVIIKFSEWKKRKSRLNGFSVQFGRREEFLILL